MRANRLNPAKHNHLPHIQHAGEMPHLGYPEALSPRRLADFRCRRRYPGNHQVATEHLIGIMLHSPPDPIGEMPDRGMAGNADHQCYQQHPQFPGAPFA